MDSFSQLFRLDAEAEHRKVEVGIAQSRGENYLACARESLAFGHSVSARVFAEEGLFLSGLCKYHVAVHEELQDFLLALSASAVESAAKA